MAIPVVYGLSCLGGPVLYVGATCKALEARIKAHWGSKTLALSPVQIWMRRLQSRSHLTVTVIDEVEPCSLKYREAEEIRANAERLFDQTGVLSLNVPHNPFRRCEDKVIAKALGGKPYRLAEYVNPYAMTTQPTEVRQ